MAVKVNLKKYTNVDGKWRFVPVLKVDGKPRPEAVLIDGTTVKGTSGKFYLEYRQEGKRIQRPCGVTPREALDAWKTQMAILSGVIEVPEESEPLPGEHTSITDAVKSYLNEVKATKSAATHDAYTSDLIWFKVRLKRSLVGKVTRVDIMSLFAAGREEGLAQATINRRIMVGLMALRNAGSDIRLKKGDWPKVSQDDVEIYEPEDIKTFFAACTDAEKLIFKTFLLTGFRAREVSTLTWDSVDLKRNTLGVKERTAYKFKPKSYEARSVPVPASFMADLKTWQKNATHALVFPTPPHPKRPQYGGDQPNAHHLEMCKAVAHRAGLNCGRCVLISTAKNGKKRTRRCATGPYCEGWYLHRWRHTYATNLLQSAIDIRTVQFLLGHKNIATTEKYLKSLRVGDLSQKIEASSLAKLVL
jgi:integrase/recombinase XerD